MGFCSKRMRYEGVTCDGHADAARARPRSFPATPIVVDVDID